jgi:hypothetical protein
MQRNRENKEEDKDDELLIFPITCGFLSIGAIEYCEQLVLLLLFVVVVVVI